MIDWTDPARLFRHHAPTEEQVVEIVPIRATFEALANALREVVPAGADRTAAERALHQAQQAYIFALVAPNPERRAEEPLGEPGTPRQTPEGGAA